MVSYYLVIGLAFYIGLSVGKPYSFYNVTILEILKGFALGVILWPVGLGYMTEKFIKDIKKIKK